MLVVCCVFSHADDDDHGGRRGNTARALAQWQHLVASCEATVALHRAMWLAPYHSELAPYHSNGMVIEIAIKFVTFDWIVDKSAARKKILPFFNDLVKSLRPCPRPTPCLHRPCAGLGKTKTPPAGEGGSSPWWGCLCLWLWLCFNTSSYIKNYGAGVFCSRLNLNSCKAVKAYLAGKFGGNILLIFLNGGIAKYCMHKYQPNIA